MNKITIIIAHYDPGDSNKIKNVFIKTLVSIEQQINDFDVEVIVADDGSYYTSFLESTLDINKIGSSSYYNLNKNQINKLLMRYYYHKTNIVSSWIVLPKEKNKMYKAKVLNEAVLISKGDFIFFLDDDNFFSNNKSIENIFKLFKSYKIIFGQIIDNNGRIRPYTSSRVQGTTFGVDKEIFNQINGYSEWTIKMSNGVDSDIWWKLFNYAKGNKIKGCYTSSIQTIDSCSKRWKKFSPKILRTSKLRKEFYKQYGCKNYKSKIHNPSRNKALWLDNLT